MLLTEFASRDLRMLPPRGLPKLGLLAVSLLLVVLSAVPDAARAEFNFARYKETDLDEFLDGGDRPPASTSTRCRR
jgi:hypothetical protein